MTEVQNKAEAHARLWSFIKDIRVTMMTTHDGERLRSRPMHGFQDTFSGKLYFFSKLDSAKAQEVREDQQVNLAYSNPERHVFVSVSGHARLVRDRSMMERYWGPVVSAWFPKGLDDPDLGLIEVEVETAEFWDASESRMRYLWELARAKTVGERPNVGEHGRLNVG
jgi:general stress protein 26